MQNHFASLGHAPPNFVEDIGFEPINLVSQTSVLAIKTNPPGAGTVIQRWITLHFESITGIEPALFLLGKQVHHHLCVIDFFNYSSFTQPLDKYSSRLLPIRAKCGNQTPSPHWKCGALSLSYILHKLRDLWELNLLCTQLHSQGVNTSLSLSAGWDSNPRFQLPATCIDDISIQRYLPIIKNPVNLLTGFLSILYERVNT